MFRSCMYVPKRWAARDKQRSCVHRTATGEKSLRPDGVDRRTLAVGADFRSSGANSNDPHLPTDACKLFPVPVGMIGREVIIQFIGG